MRGYSLYRLGYPLAMKKWHHTCTSWNGKTGEWQLWVKSERVGRGFYNRVSNISDNLKNMSVRWLLNNNNIRAINPHNTRDKFLLDRQHQTCLCSTTQT